MSQELVGMGKLAATNNIKSGLFALALLLR